MKLLEADNQLICCECERQIGIGKEYEKLDSNLFIHTACIERRKRNDPLYPTHGVCPICNMELPATKECCE